MFSTLETSWDQSARRGWSALASFAFQAMALSLLLLVPLFVVQGPPRLFFSDEILAPPPAPAPPAPRQHAAAATSTNMSGEHVLQPPTIPDTVAVIRETPVAAAPDSGDLSAIGGTGNSRRGIADSTNDMAVGAPARPAPPARPPRISHWAEGNLVYRVQPVYPPIARQAGVQGTVLLRALISKTGTIEQLSMQSGHPMLARAAIEAVRQWRYRPYLLNDEPIEIETEITVNFTLARN